MYNSRGFVQAMFTKICLILWTCVKLVPLQFFFKSLNHTWQYFVTNLQLFAAKFLKFSAWYFLCYKIFCHEGANITQPPIGHLNHPRHRPIFCNYFQLRSQNFQLDFFVTIGILLMKSQAPKLTNWHRTSPFPPMCWIHTIFYFKNFHKMHGYLWHLYINMNKTHLSF